MDPMRLVCGGCGVHLRVAHAARARMRPCPRCGTPLGGALAFALEPWPSDVPPLNDSLPGATPSSRGRLGLLVGTAGILCAATSIHLLSLIIAPAIGYGPGGGALVVTPPAAPALVRDARADRPPSGEASQVRGPGESSSGAVAAVVPTAPDAVPRPAPTVGSGDVVTALAFQALVQPTEAGANGGATPSTRMGPIPPGPPLRPADRQRPTSPDAPPPPMPSPPAPPAPATAGDEPGPAHPAPEATAQPPRRRFLVRDEAGQTVVAREHGTHNGRVAVVLPDGTIGWPTTEVPTDEPFRPSTADELEKSLGAGEYAAFRVVRTRHYLVFYQSSERFARESADLLELLFDKLTQALRKQNLPVVEAEFPLVAVIFRAEDDFRANRRVAPDVQAYYEILSNRIFFFEKGSHDAGAPEVAALRKPQTVAHEGTHQLLHNVGIQPRMSPWPLWLVEGLAEYCSPPKTTRKGVAWAGLGQVNAIHLTTIRDLDDPLSSEVRGGPRAPSNRDRSRPLVEYLATRTELTPTDYALSWGLVHYLGQPERVDQLVAYIRRLNRLQPFEARTPEQQLADFRAAFGDDLVKLNARVGKHLAKLKVPDSQALPYYAVLAQEPGPGGSIRRMAMVSQSPEMIRQWADSANAAAGGMMQWQAVAYPNRTRAMIHADSWVNPGR